MHSCYSVFMSQYATQILIGLEIIQKNIGVCIYIYIYIICQQNHKNVACNII
jgi:hypothetical protein